MQRYDKTFTCWACCFSKCFRTCTITTSSMTFKNLWDVHYTVMGIALCTSYY